MTPEDVSATATAQGLEVRNERVAKLARRLIQIPSENPPGNSERICHLLEHELDAAGFETEVFEPEAGFTSLIASYSFDAPGKTLVLCGHLDVVPAGGGWTKNPWGGELIDGNLYGRGSLDMKGPLAALVVAAETVSECRLPLQGRLLVAAVADEEQGGRRGAGALLGAGKIAADGAVIGEPGDGAVVVAHRGMCFVEITTTGRSTHASMPASGVNAVEVMVDVLAACRSLYLRHEPHPLLGSPTVAIGTTIAGGDQANVIPGSCRATLDVRKVPGMTDDSILGDIYQHLRGLGFRSPEQFDLRVIRSGEPGETEPDAEIVRTAVRSYEREIGVRPAVRGTAAATDGWWFKKAGIPTIMALGPGRMRDCHVVDEHVAVEELGRYANIYASIAVEFLSPSTPNSLLRA